MQIRDYIKKYGTDLLDTSWGVMPKWEMKMLLEEGAVEIKNGQAAIKLEPVGFVEDKSDHLIATFYGEIDLINQQYLNYKKDLKGSYHLRIGNCPVTYNRLIKEIDDYKDQKIKDGFAGLNDLEETLTDQIDFMSRDEILKVIQN